MVAQRVQNLITRKVGDVVETVSLSVCWLYYSRSDFAKADFYCGEFTTVCKYVSVFMNFPSFHSVSTQYYFANILDIF
jgi:hypothetical protein